MIFCWKIFFIWHTEANQIRTNLGISKSGFYVIKSDDFGTIFMVKCDNQFVIIEINPMLINYVVKLRPNKKVL